MHRPPPRRAMVTLRALQTSCGVLAVAAFLALAQHPPEIAAHDGAAGVASSYAAVPTEWTNAGPLDVPTIGVVPPGSEDWFDPSAEPSFRPSEPLRTSVPVPSRSPATERQVDQPTPTAPATSDPVTSAADVTTPPTTESPQRTEGSRTDTAPATTSETITGTTTTGTTTTGTTTTTSGTTTTGTTATSGTTTSGTTTGTTTTGTTTTSGTPSATTTSATTTSATTTTGTTTTTSGTTTTGTTTTGTTTSATTTTGTSTSETTPTTPTPTPTPTPEPTPTPPPAETNDRGNVVLAYGEELTVFDSSGAAAFAIAVDRIVTDVVCTAPESTPAVHGHLIALDLRVSTDADLSVLGDGPAIRALDFRTLAADGTPAEAATPSAESCLPAAESFPTGPLSAGQELAGTLVLDVAAPSGTVVFAPDFLAAGAEWAYAPSEPAGG